MSEIDDAIRLLNNRGYEVFKRADRHISSTTVTCRPEEVDYAKDMLLKRFPSVTGLEARIDNSDVYSYAPITMHQVTVGFVYYPDTMAAKPAPPEVNLANLGFSGGFLYGAPAGRGPEAVTINMSDVTPTHRYAIRDYLGIRRPEPVVVPYANPAPPARAALAPGTRRVVSDYEGGPWYDPHDLGRANSRDLQPGEEVINTLTLSGGRSELIIRMAP